MYYSYLIKDNKQYSPKTKFTYEQYLQKLMDGKIIKENESTLWEEPDGCTKQYICPLAVYLIIIISLSLNISMYRSIGAPGHGKYVVDGIIEIYHIYLR